MRTRAWLAAAVLAFSSASALADLEVRSQLGFGGRWVTEASTPLAIDLSNTGREPVAVEMTVSQGEGMLASDIVQRRIVRIAPGAAREELFLVPGPRQWTGALHVELKVDPAVPIHTPTESSDRGSLGFNVSGTNPSAEDQLPYATQVLGVVGDANGRFAARLRALGAKDANNRWNRAHARVEAMSVPAEYLRLAPLGFDGVDALVLCDPDAQTCADPAAKDGVLDWVALGGTLVVSLGEHAGSFSASPLAEEMPATWTGAVRTSYPSLLADLGAKPTDTKVQGPWVVLEPRTPTGNEPLGRHDGSPLRVERRLGRGRIVLVPYDLKTAITAPWLDDADVRRLLAPFTLPVTDKDDENDPNRWNHVEYSGAIGRTLQAGAFEPPPLPLVVLGIILYVVVVGPLDWVVLKRLKKERLTTLTFLGAVLTFTLLAYGASLLLFSSGARVNRIVIADLVDTGREGRQLLRFTDIAGYYSPTGSDQDVAYSMPAVVMPPSLPGSNIGGDVGSTMPVQVASNDPLHPKALVQLAFRSQRVVRVISAGTLGATIDVEWKDGGVRVIDGLPVDLDDVALYVAEDTAYSLGAVASGATSYGGRFEVKKGERDRLFEDASSGNWGSDGSGGPVQVRHLLEAMTVGPDARFKTNQNVAIDEVVRLRKCGVDCAAAFSRGHGVLVAHASKFPVALPGTTTAGSTYVVFRKEVEIP